MVAPKGRPKTDNAKHYTLRLRLDKPTLAKLDECCKVENLSRSEIVRKGIEEQHGKIKK